MNNNVRTHIELCKFSVPNHRRMYIFRSTVGTYTLIDIRIINTKCRPAIGLLYTWKIYELRCARVLSHKIQNLWIAREQWRPV